MFVAGVVLAVLALTTAANAFLYAFRSRAERLAPDCVDDDEGGPWFSSFVAFCRETLAILAVLALYPLGWLPDRRQESPRQAAHLILVHGLGFTRGALRILARRLDANGYGVSVFSYSTRRVDVAAAALRDYLNAQPKVGAPVYLIGYGLGGLVARYAVRRFRLPGVRGVITLAAPHQGSQLATWLPGFALLNPDSDFLRHLNTGDHTPEQFGSTAIHSEFDALVVPGSLAYYPGGYNIRVRGIGHFSFLFSRKVVDLVMESLSTEA